MVIVPTPAAAMGPYALVLAGDGTVVPWEGGWSPDEMVPQVLPGEGDALLALFAAFPSTQVVRVDEGQ